MAERNDNTGNSQDKGNTPTNTGADKSGKAQGLTDERQQGATKPMTTDGRAASGSQSTPQSGDKSSNQNSAARQGEEKNTSLGTDAEDASEATTDDDAQGAPGDAKRTTAQTPNERKSDSTQSPKDASNDRGIH